MRILHTSDWHLGRDLYGRSRQTEQERFVDELCSLVKDEDIHLVLIAGDVYDTVNPSAFAEELFYDCLDRLADGGRRAVVAIAGNHDSPERLCAASPLAIRHGITLFGLPKEVLSPNVLIRQDRVARVRAGQGWAELHIPGCPHPAMLALLPFPSEARLNEALTETLDDEDWMREEYSARVKQLFARLSGQFRADTVNLGISHLFVRGGLESESERPLQRVGGTLAVDPEALPEGAHYVALGHLHRAQMVKKAPVPTRYSGSPLAYSFSEAGQAKSVVIIEAEPEAPARVREVILNAGHPLVKWQATGGLAQLQRWLDEGRDPDAWIELEINLTQPLTMAEVAKIRQARERIINIVPVFPVLEPIAGEGRAHLPIEELFRRFYRRQTNGGEPEPGLVNLFLKLIADVEHAGSEDPVAVASDEAEEVGGR